MEEGRLLRGCSISFALILFLTGSPQLFITLFKNEIFTSDPRNPKAIGKKLLKKKKKKSITDENIQLEMNLRSKSDGTVWIFFVES